MLRKIHCLELNYSWSSLKMMNFLFPVEAYFQIFLNHLVHLALDFKESFSFFLYLINMLSLELVIHVLINLCTLYSTKTYACVSVIK